MLKILGQIYQDSRYKVSENKFILSTLLVERVSFEEAFDGVEEEEEERE